MNSFTRAVSTVRGSLLGIVAGGFFVACAGIATAAQPAATPETRQYYLSGHGPKDAVPWDFFCTAGRRSGEWTSIPVPSQWEQHGFGGYDYGQGSAKRAEEHGRYRRQFNVPAAWAGMRVRIVFEGVMTDTAVTINGKPAGPVHVGGFYRFRHDITELVKRDAENLLEVDVAKVSSTRDTEIAERHADYWVFGGIYRPVYLEAVPPQSIEQVSIDARADGRLTADVGLALVKDADRVDAQVFDTNDQPVGEPFSVAVPGGGVGAVRLAATVPAARPWTAETPQLYRLRTTLRRGAETLHVVTTRFGFRTFEVRPGAGLFLNGERIVLKGVNRHSFRADTGRALTREDCYEDVRLIQAMNMNAVRMSHYPPDVAFLEACDELGLYVLDELSGWQHAHDTDTGRRLIREMLTRDVNHPGILFWDNGNEGGWNRAVDAEFSRFDLQRRPVLHPRDTFSGIDTIHYRSYDDMAKRARGPHLIMPTEFLHGLFDGGGGAGLHDYWPLLSRPPFGAGGFLWVLADEGIVRTDHGGRIDTWSTYGPDGLVGPRHEKEPSFYTVREVFSPVQIEPPVLDDQFDGRLTVHNRYSFTSLEACRFAWRTVRFGELAAAGSGPGVVNEGNAPSPAVKPAASGALKLALPRNWNDADALAVTVSDPQGRELWTWMWPTPGVTARLREARAPRAATVGGEAKMQREGELIILSAGKVRARFAGRTGLLRDVQRDGAVRPISNGPRFVWAVPASTDHAITWTNLAGEARTETESRGKVWTAQLPTAAPGSIVEMKFEPGAAWYGAKLEVSDGQRWTTVFDGTRRSNDGDRYTLSPRRVAAIRVSNLHRSDQQPVALRSVRLGHAPTRFPSDDERMAISSGTAGQGSASTAWIEARGSAHQFRWTIRADGSLQLDFSYSAPGPHVYRGVTFDCAAEQMTGARWIGQGPNPVWKNRMQGTWFGRHELARATAMAPNSPEWAGYFAGVRAMRVNTTNGAVDVACEGPDTFIRVGTRLTDFPNTSPDFPPGDFSILDAIPAIGSKFGTAAESGPTGAPAEGAEAFKNHVVFRFDD
ncbi:MAG: glycoside hydrolase family 2 TIM barrel-domain containing protein [Opitutaceae bacterium]|nr:glycoside hydrolase family 2 TIM barrel-domain containing protein [Opitutaceae bacterium]